MHSSMISLLPIPAAIMLVFLSSLSHPSIVFAQNTAADQCRSSLLTLAPCAQFVQGMAAAPTQTCCHSLDQLYSQKPTCLCLLLNNTNLASLPINTTLALQLPLRCNLQMDASKCAGISLPTISPAPSSQHARPNATVAALPIVTAAPRPSLMGFGLRHSAQVRLTAQGQSLILLLLAIFTVSASS